MGDKLVVLCTGSEGYLGSVLVSNLMSNSRVGLVIGVDACFFGENVRDTEGKYFLIRDRVERMERGWGYWLDELGPDVVISLAAISNDPACELNPSVTKLVNHYSVVHLAYECMLRKIKFVFASSASVYGSIDYHVGEWSPEFPISLYAKEKLETERDLFNMSTDEWKPQVFRMGTLFGVSGRPRFDLVIPLMLKDALLNSAIDVYGGNQWRPFLSLDVAAAMYELYVLGYLDSIKPVKNLVSFNARIIDLARSIARYVEKVYGKPVSIRVHSDSVDSRNYRVENALFEFKDETFHPYLDAMSKQILSIEDLSDTRYYTVARLKEVL